MSLTGFFLHKVFFLKLYSFDDLNDFLNIFIEILINYFIVYKIATRADF